MPMILWKSLGEDGYLILWEYRDIMNPIILLGDFMLYAAIIDDEREQSDILMSYFRRFGAEKGISVNTFGFSDAVDFLTKYQPIYDAVFMDIEMPHINGFEAAERLRELDPKIPLVFVTSYAQYAPKGYEVDASGYLVKPVSYVSFYTLMDKVLRVSARDKDAELLIHMRDGIKVLPYSEIMYIEISGHNLKYVTERGTVEASGSFTALEQILPPERFARPSNSFIVHLKFVRGTVGNSVFVNTTEIPISRARKKEFMIRLMRYFGDKV